MKKKKLNGKLSLKKDVISNLNMSRSKGGYIKETYYWIYTAETCNVCSDPPNECDEPTRIC